MLERKNFWITLLKFLQKKLAHSVGWLVGYKDFFLQISNKTKLTIVRPKHADKKQDTISLSKRKTCEQHISFWQNFNHIYHSFFSLQKSAE